LVLFERLDTELHSASKSQNTKKEVAVTITISMNYLLKVKPAINSTLV